MSNFQADLGWSNRVAALFCVLTVGGCGLLGFDLLEGSTATNVQFYTVPFVCESDDSGQLVNATSVILYNPESGDAEVYRRAALIVLETDPAPPGVVWDREVIEAGVAVRLDCDAFARILTNDPTATFDNQFGDGVRVDGFLTIGVESDSEIPRLEAVVQQQVANELGETSISSQEIDPTPISVTGWPPETG